MNRVQATGHLLAVFGWISIILAAGCSAPVADQTDSTTGKVDLRKQYLHCPDSFQPSITRMRQIHDAINSDDPLPEPRDFEIREIVHGTGPSAHSHYHLAGKQITDSHHQNEQTVDEKTHVVTVDPFEEFRDVAWVSPIVAADSDMAEADWLVVKKVSRQIVKLFDEVIVADHTDEQKRSALQQNQVKFNQFLEQLEAVVPVNPDTGDAATTDKHPNK